MDQQEQQNSFTAQGSNFDIAGGYPQYCTATCTCSVVVDKVVTYKLPTPNNQAVDQAVDQAVVQNGKWSAAKYKLV